MPESDEDYARAVSDYENRQIYHDLFGCDENEDKLSAGDRDELNAYKSRKIEEFRKQLEQPRNRPEDYR